jgi:hypothetical protein
MARNEALGLGLWLASLVLVGGVAALPRTRACGWLRLWPLPLLAAIHPGWWMSARSGDCGLTLIVSCLVMTALTLVAAAFLWWRGATSGR